MHWPGYLIIVLLSTFTGWAVTRITVKILFHPRRPVKLFGFTLQGVLPKNQPLIAEKLGQLVSKELFSFTAIEQKVTNPENFQKLKPEIEAHIDNFLTYKLKEVFPMLSMFIGEKTINQMKSAFLQELEKLFPVLMKGYISKMQQDFDPEKTVAEKVAEFSLEKLENILYRDAAKQLRLFQLFGALFGFLMGLTEVAAAFLMK